MTRGPTIVRSLDPLGGRYVDPQHAALGTWGRVFGPTGAPVSAGFAEVCDAEMCEPGRVSLRWSAKAGTVVTFVRAKLEQYRGSALPPIIVDVPTWGMVLPVGAGRVRVSVQVQSSAQTVEVEAGLALGAPVAHWLDGGTVSVGDAITTVLSPPQWARRLQFTTLQGTFQKPDFDSTTAGVIIPGYLPARAWQVTGGPGTGGIAALCWETFN